MKRPANSLNVGTRSPSESGRQIESGTEKSYSASEVREIVGDQRVYVEVKSSRTSKSGHWLLRD